jgi:mRNA interferase YafQ
MRKTKYTVKPTTQFKKDFKLAMKRGLKIELLEEVIAALAMGETLSEKHKDHALTGNWVGTPRVSYPPGLAADLPH